MKAYSGNDTQCPKCGCKWISTKYYQADEFNREALVRSCGNCNHAWQEEPLDANQKEQV